MVSVCPQNPEESGQKRKWEAIKNSTAAEQDPRDDLDLQPIEKPFLMKATWSLQPSVKLGGGSVMVSAAAQSELLEIFDKLMNHRV